MKILHTADWHLGRSLDGQPLLEDQAHLLTQLVDLAVAEAVDVVVVAGDVYDRAVPPADAVALLDEVLTRLAGEARIPVLVVAGNHDSPTRLGFGGRLLAPGGVVLRGRLDDLAPVVLDDAHGPVAFYPVPYVEPVFARALPGGAAVTDHQEAVSHVVGALRAAAVPGRRAVLIGHAFVAGGRESESERPLAVGGSGAVRPDTFAGFDLVLLGHLHRPQTAGSPRLTYAGSLLKYSFAEADHAKSVTLVELDGAGGAVTRRVPLAPRRDLRVIVGSFQELVTRPEDFGPRDDYLCAHLTDPGPVLEPMARLRAVYPHLLELQFRRPAPVAGAAPPAADRHRREPVALFRAFYRDMVGEELDAAHLEAFRAALHVVGETGAEEP
jgi:exonuclease SbcD